ncbi:unnamed protein product [Strongylus vulgaris]|uniref:Uncharacterized protein n=1 Tax=Strongylus vulgaris TaxID=40348 RepID=A0A3P7IZ14_STRVU|nr:unnamed protein product [Strongylus vulgaris]
MYAHDIMTKAIDDMTTDHRLQLDLTFFFQNAAVLREELRSVYDPSQDYRTGGYGASDARNYYSSNASPSYSKKLDENQSWASEPRRFEVYKTRAEREVERNTHTPSGASSYRPASNYSDRPLNNYAVRKVKEPEQVCRVTYLNLEPSKARGKYLPYLCNFYYPEDSYKMDQYRSDPYRRFEHYSYKRTPYDFEKGSTPGTDSYTSSATSHALDNPLVMNR